MLIHTCLKKKHFLADGASDCLLCAKDAALEAVRKRRTGKPITSTLNEYKKERARKIVEEHERKTAIEMKRREERERLQRQREARERALEIEQRLRISIRMQERDSLIGLERRYRELLEYESTLLMNKTVKVGHRIYDRSYLEEIRRTISALQYRILSKLPEWARETRELIFDLEARNEKQKEKAVKRVIQKSNNRKRKRDLFQDSPANKSTEGRKIQKEYPPGQSEEDAFDWSHMIYLIQK